MARPVTMFTGQWADLKLEALCKKLKSFGYDGAELACWGDHFEVDKATQSYCDAKRKLLKKYGLEVYAISNHLAGQAVCDNIDERHKCILPPRIYGDGKPEGVRQRAAAEMIETAKAAKRLGVKVVNGFTGSSIWHLLYSFPPVSKDMVAKGYKDFAKRWLPILDEFKKLGVKFALEAHPTEIAFDIASAERAVEAVNGHPAFGFNFDPSHFGYQGVDYVEFIHRFKDRIFHVHMKDVGWSSVPTEVGRLRRAHRLWRQTPLLGLPLAGPRQDQLRGGRPRPEPDQLPGAVVGRVGGLGHGPRARRRRGLRVRQAQWTSSRPPSPSTPPSTDRPYSSLIARRGAPEGAPFFHVSQSYMPFLFLGEPGSGSPRRRKNRKAHGHAGVRDRETGGEIGQ